MMRVVVFLAVLFLVGGCGTTTPRFGQDIQTALASEDMRRIETEDLRLYFAERDRDTAERMLSRFEGCLDELRRHAKIRNRASREKLVIVVPHLPLNNAYVFPAAAGQEHHAVTPSFFTADLFTLLGKPPDASAIGCHELAHYVQGRQLSGLPNILEAVFGYILPPELGLEPWFWEGLAVYYETKLQRGIGRLSWLLWNGTFAAGVADEGLRQSDVNDGTRRIPHGAQYLVGSHFIDWLASTFGEEKLWDLIGRQSDEVLPPLDVSGRFRNTYGRPLDRLYSDFAADMKKRYPRRERPASERIVHRLDQNARYAISAHGTEAIVDDGMDTPPRLRVISPSGKVLVDRDLTDLVPSRDLVAPSALASSGLSFTSDDAALYWVALDTGKTFSASRLVRLDIATEKLTIVSGDVGGSGGSVAPDGTGYYFGRARGDRWELARFDFATGRTRTIADYGPQTYPALPRVSPDGTRIATALWRKDGVELLLVDAVTGAVQMRVPGPGNAEPSWSSNDELLYVGEADGRSQVFRVDVASGSVERLSDAPYAAFSPHRHGSRVRFLNRAGWAWTVDEIDARPVPGSQPVPPTYAKANATAAPEVRPEISRDEPYSQTDHLFVPTLRGPSFAAVSDLSTTIGTGITGGDRLGFHRWGIESSWDFAAKEPSVAVRYFNGQLAPVLVSVAGERLATRENIVFGPIERDFVRRETLAAVAVSRRFWTTTVSTAFRYDELSSMRALSGPPMLTPLVVPYEQRLAGASTSISYAATETTLAAGSRRALAVDLSAGMFPGLTGPAVGDLRLAVGIVRPLPLSRRHTLTIEARGRTLPSSESGLPSLQVGGNVANTELSRELTTSAGFGSQPLVVRFHEPLRGFEDLGLLGNRAVLGDIMYRLPIVLDVGSITTLGIFPSLLLRQIDLEAFGSGASLLDGRVAAAAGGAAIARLRLWSLPFGLGVQAARRFTQDEGWNVIFAGGN